MNINYLTGEVRLDAEGREIPDPNPMEVPLGMKRPETLAEQVQRLVRTSISQHAALNGMETFEEAEDFSFDDEDFDPSTPYELEFDPVLGKEITAADFQNADKRQWLRDEYERAIRNQIRAEERQAAIDEAYKESRKTAARRQSAPSSEKGPEAPSAEPQKA